MSIELPDEASDEVFDADEALKQKVPFWRAFGVSVFAFLGVGVLEAIVDWSTSRLGDAPRNVGTVLRAQVPWWFLWILFAPAVLALARRYRFDGPRWPRSAVIHASIGAIISLSHSSAYAALANTLLGAAIAPTPLAQVRIVLGRFLFMDLMTYMAAIGAYWSYEYFRHFRSSALAAARMEAQAARLQLRLADARIHALRMELNPHFLFNALNSVAGLVRRREPEGAVDMLARLGELLRVTLNRDMPPEVTLAEELALLRRFLDIELVRFGDRLRVVWDIDAETYDAFVPPLILQPLVENALRHGIARRSGAGLLHVSARKVGLQLELAVRDTGEGIMPRTTRPERQGIGLSNTRARLEELYGAEVSSVDLANAAGGGARARVYLPFHLSRGQSHAAAGA
ncbi:MAG: histidine kinase [Gemmatimonadaceae bacterium]|nr:histidine kinase [Gemmatimonadaceae bacterium]